MTFEDLEEENPHEPPDENFPNEDVPDPANFSEYLKFFRTCVTHYVSKVDLEEIAKKMDLWDEIDEICDKGRRPKWVEIEQQPQLANWGGVLIHDLECNRESIETFQFLVKNRGPRGLMEGSRIIYHLLKDKQMEGGAAWDSGWAGWEPEEPGVRNSRWLVKASEEAIEALDKPDIWNTGGPLAERHRNIRRREMDIQGGKEKWKDSKDKGAWRQGLR